MKKDLVRRIDSTRPRGNGQGAIVAARASGSGNADTLDGYDAALLPKPSHIPVSGPDGKLDRGWLPDGAGSVLAAPVSMGGQLFVAPWVLLARALHVSDSVLYVADGRVLTAGDVVVLSRAGYGQEEMTILDDGQVLGDAYAYGVGRSEDRIEFPAGTFAANLGNPADGGGYVTIVSGEQAGGVTKGAHLNVWSWQSDGTRVRRARHGYLQGLNSSEKAFFPDVEDWNIWGSYTDEGFFRGTVHAIGGDFAGNVKVSGTVSVPSGKGRAGVVLGEGEGGHGFVLQNAEGRPVFAAVAPYEEDGQVLSDVAVYIDNKGEKGLFYHLDPASGEYRLEIGVETLIDGRLTAPNILAGLGVYPGAFTGMRLGSEGLQSFGTDYIEQIALDIQDGYFYFGGREGWLYEKGIAIDTRGLVQGLDELEHTIHWIHQTNRTADGGFIGASIGSMAGQLFATVRRYLTDLNTGDLGAQAIDTFVEAQLWLEPGSQNTTYLYGQNVELRGDYTAALSVGALNPARAVLTSDGRFATDRLTVGGTALHTTDDKQSVLIGTTSATGARLIVMEDARPAFMAMRSDNQSFAVTVAQNLRTYLSASGALALSGGAIDSTGMGLVMPSGLMRLGSQAAPWQDVYGVRGHFSSLGSQTTLAGKFFLTQRHMTLTVPLDVEDVVAYAREGDLPVGDFMRYEDTDTGGWEIIRVNTTGTLTGDGWYEYELDRAAAGTAQRWEMGTVGASLGGNDTDGFIWWYGTDDRNPGTGPALVVQQRDNDDHPDSISERAIFGNMAGWYDFEAGYPVYGVAFGRPVGRWVSLDEEQGFRVMFADVQRAVYREYTQIGTDAGNNVYISDSSLALRVGSTAFIEMDNAGDMDLTGTLAVATGGAITWAGGKGRADDTGIEHVEDASNFWKVKPDASAFMAIAVDTDFTSAALTVENTNGGGLGVSSESATKFAFTAENNSAGAGAIFAISDAGVAIKASTDGGTALQIVGGIVDGGSQRYTALADATAATDALNRQTGDGRYLLQTGATAGATAQAQTFNLGVNVATGYHYAINSVKMLATRGTLNYMVGPSGNATMSGDSNMLMGSGAGIALTTGSGDLFIGVNAGVAATQATSCVALGSNALQTLTTATGVIGIGNGAGYTTNADHGMYIGSGAGYYQTGARIVAIGSNSVRGAIGSSTAADIVGIGCESFIGATTGGENVGVGSWTGVTTNPAYKTTTGLQCTYIGTYAGQASATQRDRAIAIGYRAFVDASNTCVIGGTGYFLVDGVIGATTAGAHWDVVGGADKLQLRAKAYSSQTAAIFQAQDSSANVLFSVDKNGAIIANEQGADADSRIEGDTDANLTFWDASADKVGIGTNAPSAKLDINSDVVRLRTAKTPASASATGNAGDICWDASYIYVCTATDTWKRAAIATW